LHIHYLYPVLRTSYYSYPSWCTPWGFWHGFMCPLSFSLAEGLTNLYFAHMSACWST
jgi:hypothetical protein